MGRRCEETGSCRGERRSVQEEPGGGTAGRRRHHHAGLPIAYCERWNPVLEMPFSPMGEAEARSRHEKGELYTALLGDPAAPEAMVDVRLETGYVATHFFDDCLRNVFSTSTTNTMEGCSSTATANGNGTRRVAACRRSVRSRPDGHV